MSLLLLLLVVAVGLIVSVEVVEDVDCFVIPRFSMTNGVALASVDIVMMGELLEAYIICFSTSKQAINTVSDYMKA